MKSILISINLIILYTSPSFAIIDGQELTSHIKNPFVALDISIQGVFGSAPCSGTYLGDGKIITAAHCFLLSEYETEKVSICISDSSKKEQLCLQNFEYEVSLPPVQELGPKAPTRKNRKVIQIPKPDIALVKVKSTEHLLFKNLDIAHIDFSQVQKVEDIADIMIFGQGCTKYSSFGEELKGLGIYHSEMVKIEITQGGIDWTSKWTSVSKNSGVCWGDSGGALAKQEDGIYKVKGVISSMKTIHDRATGAPAEVTSFYGKLNTAELQKWFSSQLGHRTF